MTRNTFHTALTAILTAVAAMLSFVTAAGAQELRIPDDMDPAKAKARPLFRQDTVTIRFFGDIMIHSMQIQTARTEAGYDFGSYFKLMESYLDDSDLNVGNMEFTLGGEPYTGYPSFSAPDRYGEHLAECGFGVFLCANNHIFDKGTAGLERTLRSYRSLGDRYGVRFTGAAGDEKEQNETTPLIVNIRGIRIAFINSTYGTNSSRSRDWPKTNLNSEKDMLGNAIRSAKERADVTIALIHWGEEYILRHSKTQEEYAAWLAHQGVDLIIGTHPHVVQDADAITSEGRTVPVVYSLGNSVSNMSAANTQLGLMITLRIIRHCNGDISIAEPGYRFTWCSRPGGYDDSYHVIPLTDYLGRKEEWKSASDYEKMLNTYRNITKETGISEINK